jgi:hypothetical protein
MDDFSSTPTTAFVGTTRLARGPLSTVALAVRAALQKDATASILVFDDLTGRVIDLDLRGGELDVLRRLQGGAEVSAAEASDKPAGRGRPKLGVVPREVTLLPRHWDWLSGQPGGASQALRRLVEQARAAEGGRRSAKALQEAAYRFMSAMAGDFPRFEEASRALFAGDRERLEAQTQGWPKDVREHLMQMLDA